MNSVSEGQNNLPILTPNSPFRVMIASEKQSASGPAAAAAIAQAAAIVVTMSPSANGGKN
jgi:hypothetical protein